MKTKHKLHLSIYIVLLTNYACTGQISNYIYALNNAATGVFNFCKIEISTGAITNFQFAANGVSNEFSSSINEQGQEYYLCTGGSLATFDPNSGNLVSTVNLPISPTASFLHIQYNPCDSNIYGIINDYPASISFARFNKASATMTTISALNPNTAFCFGCMSILDPDSGIFAFDNGNITGLDIYSGQMIYSSPIINLPNEDFHHIALKCSTHEIFGTSANVNAGVKYLSTINPYTGVVTHVSNPGWNVGIFKPAGGGDCINQYSGNYYYSAAGHALVGANTITGNMIYNQTISSGELFFVQHFSECTCKSTGLNEVFNHAIELNLIPNPFFDKLNVTTNTNESFEIIFYDIASRKIFWQKFANSTTLNMKHLAKGIYLYEVRNNPDGSGRVIKKGKIVKE